MTALWNKIKLIWNGRKIATDLLKIRSRWKDPAFWAALLGNLITAVGSFQGIIPMEWASAMIVVNSLLSAGYNYTRGLQKAQTDGVKPYSSTSEFWLGLGTMMNNALIDMHSGGIATPALGVSTVVIGHAIAAARDLANMRPKETLPAVH